jgi:hypothetical protein
MYVQRNAQGQITGVYANPQPGYAEELLPATDPALVAFLAPKPPLDISDIDNLDKVLKAITLLTRKYANDLKAGTYVAKTVADTKGDFMTIYRALP